MARQRDFQARGQYHGFVENEASNADCETEALEPVRVDSVASRIEQWSTEVNQAPGGNALRNLDSLDNLLDLADSHPAGIAQLYGDRPTKPSVLFRDLLGLGSACSILSRTDTKKQQSLVCYRLYPTYLVIGVASWTQLPPFRDEERGLRPDLSHFRLQHFNLPVSLRPLGLEATGLDSTLMIGGEVIVNPVFEETFADRNITLDSHQILKLDTRTDFDFHQALQTLRGLGLNHIPSFDLKENLLVTNLRVSEAILASDQNKTSSIASENSSVRAFAGDMSAKEELLSPLTETPPKDCDPDYERRIGDFDVSQARVIEIAASGRSLFMDVPPGVPDAATVEAVVADTAASDKQICYMSGARRIDKAVLNGLKQANLEDFIPDLAGFREWQAGLHDQPLATPDQNEPVTPVLLEELDVAHIRLHDTREKLQNHTRRLYTSRQP